MLCKGVAAVPETSAEPLSEVADGRLDSRASASLVRATDGDERSSMKCFMLLLLFEVGVGTLVLTEDSREVFPSAYDASDRGLACLRTAAGRVRGATLLAFPRPADLSEAAIV